MAARKTKWFLIILLIFVVLGSMWGIAFFIGSGSLSGGAAYDDFEEEIVEEGTSSQKIAMINVVGEIFSDPDRSSAGASDSNIIAQLDRAERDDNVAGVLINLETPGGGVVASDAIYQRVLELKKDGKPVVAMMGDVAASGGYYVAAAADEVVAHPSTWTGSIGVIAFLPNVEKATEKIGVEITVLKSGPFKDAGSPFRALSDEDRRLFQSLIDEAYSDFVKAVSDGRKLDEQRVRGLADGRIYSGRQALDAKLVDHLGGRDLAFQRVKDLADTPDASLVLYRSPSGLTDLLGVTAAKVSGSTLKKELGLPRRPGVSYLWLP